MRPGIIASVFICLVSGATVPARPERVVEELHEEGQSFTSPQSHSVDVSGVIDLLRTHEAKYRRFLDISPKPAPARERAATNETSVNGPEASIKCHTKRINKKHRRKQFEPYSKVRLYSGSSGYAEDALYIGQTAVGEGQQPFWTTYDTGSFGFLVPSRRCGLNEGCIGSPDTKYNERGYAKGMTADLYYRGVTSYHGDIYTDKVKLGAISTSTSELISFTYCANPILGLTSQTRSIMGLGFQSGFENFLQSAAREHVLDGQGMSKEVGFFFGRRASNTNSMSSMSIGGTDTSRYTGDIYWLDEFEDNHLKFWQVPLNDVLVNDVAIRDLSPQNRATIPGRAILDTGEALIVTDQAAAAATFAHVPGAFPIVPVSAVWPPPGVPVDPARPQPAQDEIHASAFTMFAFPCADPPNISFVLSDKAFWINALDISFGQLGPSGDGFRDPPGVPEPGPYAQALGGSVAVCLSSIVARQQPLEGYENYASWVLGTSFLKNWYSVYNLDVASSPKMGLAKAIDHPNTSRGTNGVGETIETS